MTPYLFIRFCPVCFNYTMDHLSSQEVIARLFFKDSVHQFFSPAPLFPKNG